MLVFVTATRYSRSDFDRRSPLARSLPRMGQITPLGLKLHADNRRPLADCYNEAIDDAADDDLLVFVHDDVFIDDWMAGARVAEALTHFDVIGVAGNRRRLPAQVAWYLRPEASANPAQPEQHVWDVGSLAGAIAHGTDPAQASVSEYGPAPAPVRLIDGVFIAARAGRLRQTGVRFDPQLGFHFYDLDFCRAAESAGLRIGVWPIALTHASSGASIQSQAWEQSMRRYLEKWGEPLPPVEHAVRTAVGSSVTVPSS